MKRFILLSILFISLFSVAFAREHTGTETTETSTTSSSNTYYIHHKWNCIQKDSSYVALGDTIGGTYTIKSLDWNGENSLPSSCIGTGTNTQYSISYTLNSGSLSGNVVYNSDGTFTLPQVTKSGYTFLGWTGSNGDTPQTTVTVSAGTTGNLTYTANWLLTKTQYKVTYSVEENFTNTFGLQGVLCSTNGYHTHNVTLPVPSNATVKEIRIQYYHANEAGGTGATLQASKDNSNWVTIATGEHHSGVGGQLWTTIDTSYRYMRIVHYSSGNRSVVDGGYSAVIGTKNLGNKTTDWQDSNSAPASTSSQTYTYVSSTSKQVCSKDDGVTWYDCN